MIAAILPPRVFATHSLNLCTSLSEEESFYLLAVANSFCFDWLLRLKVSANLTVFYLMQMPVPRLTSGTVFDQLVARARKLVSGGELGSPASQQGLSSNEYRSVRAEIDAIVAHLYGINEAELSHILSSFPISEPDQKRLVLEAFREWKLPPDDPTVRMIDAGESLRVEFKSSARWDVQRKQVNKELEHVVVKTVAAFMNSDGGTLLIGVADDGTILGLDADYATIGKKNADAYENWLMTRLMESLGRDRVRLIRVSFHKIEGQEICRIDVERSSRAVFTDDPQGNEKLYIRAGNSTRDLRPSEVVDYCNDHFIRGVAPAARNDVSAQGETPVPAAPSGPRTLGTTATPERRTASFPTHGLFGGAAPPPPPTPPVAGGVDDDDSTPRRRLVDQYDVEDVLLHIRDVVSSSEPIPRDEAIREIATRLGADRVGSRIRDLIESALTSASRRFITETVPGGLRAATRTIDDYDRDFLKTALRNVIGRVWTDEEDGIRAATRWLGFRRTGHKIEQAFRSAIRGALRQGQIERDGSSLRCK